MLIIEEYIVLNEVSTMRIIVLSKCIEGSEIVFLNTFLWRHAE